MSPIGQKKLFSKMLFTVLATVIVFIIALSAAAQDSPTVTQAPLNPAFLEYLRGVQEYGVQMQTIEGYALGYIPPPVDLSHLRGVSLFEVQKLVPAPASYDLRSLGKLSPVKDQENCGSCWAFATYGALESYLLPSELWDFSENNLKNTHGFDSGHCEGGNGFMSTAYLARWSGPVAEADDPYNPESNYSPRELPVQKHIQEVFYVPGRANSLDNENIKQFVMTYGALMVVMYWDSSYYDSTHKTYYYDGATNINHAVAIVGWDDNFDKNKFSLIPPGNGAFIVRNSWGKSFGEGGYFYISYYDAKMAMDEDISHMFNGTATSFGEVYQYDPLGWTSGIGYGESNTAWFANIFTAISSSDLSAVSFYTASPTSPYEIHIYQNVTSDPVSGSLTGSKAGTMAFPGYHTVSLNSPISLTAGQRFSVVVKVTTPGYIYPIPIEQPWPNYSSKATANPGESFISNNGSSGSWEDVTSYSWCQECNVCLKAFTTEKIVLQSPSDGEICTTCSLIKTHQPSFTWTRSGTFTGFTIFLSTSQTDFTTRGIFITKASVRATTNTWIPSPSAWKKIMTLSSQNRDIYWKVVGIKPDGTTLGSAVWDFRIGTPQPVTINIPPGGPLPGVTPPTFDFNTNCNVKFKLEISSVGDFGDSKKIKSFNYSTKDPNVDQKLIKTLSSFQWNSVKKLIGTGTGYFRIKAWDGIKRETVSDVRSFTVQQ
jgi:C1A family cysteine protease